jgi:chromate transporter
VASRLGVSSFGGPIAHLGYFRREYVDRRHWLDERQYADLVSLCQLLPGPASSQLGIAIGMLRAGFWGGLAAWLGFTLPSAVGMVAFAYLVRRGNLGSAPWLHGLLVVAVAVVAQAVWTMGRSLAPDARRATVAFASAALALLWPTTLGQVAIIVAAAIVGLTLLPAPAAPPDAAGPTSSVSEWERIGRGVGAALVVAFFALLVGLPLLAAADHSQAIALLSAFYRAGALVFGGGHVVLPLLQRAVVPNGWVSNTGFLAGYGAAQAVPGPLFTFAAYLGAVERPLPNGVAGAAIALGAIYLPSFLLVTGILPYWDRLRGMGGVRRALTGINAAVVGLLLAALYHPVWTSAIRGPVDLALALGAFALLAFWKLPPWIVVVATAAASGLIGAHL